MEPDTITPVPPPDAHTALADLDMLVSEVGATYPLVAYAALADEDEEADALDAAILAGLVSP